MSLVHNVFVQPVIGLPFGSFALLRMLEYRLAATFPRCILVRCGHA